MKKESVDGRNGGKADHANAGRGITASNSKRRLLKSSYDEMPKVNFL